MPENLDWATVARVVADIPEGDGQRRKQLLRVAVAVLSSANRICMLSPSSNRLSRHTTGGRASRQRNRPGDRIPARFGVEYLMGQFFAHLQRLFRRWRMCAGITQRGVCSSTCCCHHARRRVAYRGGRLIGSRPSQPGEIQIGNFKFNKEM